LRTRGAGHGPIRRFLCGAHEAILISALAAVRERVYISHATTVMVYQSWWFTAPLRCRPPA